MGDGTGQRSSQNEASSRDFIVLECWDCVQDKGPESSHCSSSLSRMQEMELVSLGLCGKSWSFHLKFSCNLLNDKQWVN